MTYARSAPNMPASVYNTPQARKRQAIFKLAQMHMKYHLRTIRQTFTPKGNGTPSNRYLSINYKALSAALDTLAEEYCAGLDVTITDEEAAISAYAAEHPTSITIGHLSGYGDVYLTGDWPATITLSALSGDRTVIVIVAENGTTTTYNTDGTVTGGASSTGGSSSGSQTGGSTSGGTQSGGDNTGSGGGNTGDGPDGD